MPQWEGIEDAAAAATPVWFFRAKDKETDEWKPLRKVDCQALNKNDLSRHLSSGTSCVYINGGRMKAYPEEGLIRHNYLQVVYQLCSATWFRKEERSKEIVLIPIAEQEETDAIEAFYQKVVAACSSLGSGLASVASESVALSDERRILLNKSPMKFIMKGKGWFGAQYDLQRGFGEYSVEGEEDEVLLGPVTHVAFVVHGVGEAMFSKETVNIPSLVEHMDTTRFAMQKRQAAEYKAEIKKAKKNGEDPPPPPTRLEIIPILWFHRIHDCGSMLMSSLQSTTLPTIPALRAIANDVIFDILMYMTPKFCQAVLECVTEQICTTYSAFLQGHPDFQGQCSLIGHSLGSVIVWDLLSVLQQHEQEGEAPNHDFHGVSIPSQDEVEIGYQAYMASFRGSQRTVFREMADHGTWGPSLVNPMKQTIPFVPECAVFLGSPLGLFLTLRGAHPVFEKLRQEEICKVRQENDQIDEETLQERVVSPFSLPTNSLYNIFHPSDPVAYRIEPLLMSPRIPPEELPPPVYLTAVGKEVRLHVKARQIADDIQRSLKDQKSGWNALIDSTLSALSPRNDTSQRENNTEPSNGPAWPPVFLLGCPQQAKRVDYSFQPAIVENEYINAVTAHSSYFSNVDFQDFMITRLMKTDAQKVPASSSTESAT